MSSGSSCSPCRICFLLGFIKKIQLASDIFRFFTGSPKKFLREIFNLLTKVSFFPAGLLPEDLQPAGALAEAAALAVADAAAHVHLGRRLREREVVGAEPRLALFAEHLGIGGETKYFDATDGVHTAHIRRAQGPAGEIELGMINVSEIRSGDGWWFLNTGVPHYVEMVHDVDGIDVNGRGRGIRYDTGRFPQGTNVNFVEVTGNGAIRMRTYERGVEHETLACGTGATAAAIITNYALQHGTTKYRIQVPGGELIVGFTHEAGTQNYTNIRLTGPARRVFSGVFETDNF